MKSNNYFYIRVERYKIIHKPSKYYYVKFRLSSIKIEYNVIFYYSKFTNVKHEILYCIN